MYPQYTSGTCNLVIRCPFSNAQTNGGGRSYSYAVVCLYLSVSLLTKGVSAPPTMVIPREELVLGISTCDTSPSRTGSRVMPVKYKKIRVLKMYPNTKIFKSVLAVHFFKPFSKFWFVSGTNSFGIQILHPIFHLIQICPAHSFYAWRICNTCMYPLAKYGAKPR